MKRILAQVKKELTQLWRDRLTLALAMVLPVLLLDQCDATVDPLDDSAIKALKKLVVDESVLAQAPLLFRAQYMPKYIWMNRDLAKEMEKLPFEGNRWIEPAAVATGDLLPSLDTLPPAANARL